MFLHGSHVDQRKCDCLECMKSLFLFFHTGEESGLQFSRRFIAALTETTFKQCGTFVYCQFYRYLDSYLKNDFKPLI